jgi:hypothetical protein
MTKAEQIKELLMGGMTISHAYKRERDDWMGTVKIFISPGMRSEPSIILESPMRREAFPVTTSGYNTAIQGYLDLVHDKTNLAYLLTESLAYLNSQGQYLDLDEPKHFKQIRRMIETNIKTNDRPINPLEQVGV